MKRQFSACQILAACTHLSSTVSQLFEPQVQKHRRFHVQQLTFLFPLETPLRLSRNVLHGWKDNSMLAKPLAACTYSIFNGFRVIRCLSQCVSPKIAIFTTFLFLLRTPLGQSRKVLYGWKENSMLTKLSPACAHLTITVSEIERDIGRKSSFFIPPCI